MAIGFWYVPGALTWSMNGRWLMPMPHRNRGPCSAVSAACCAAVSSGVCIQTLRMPVAIVAVDVAPSRLASGAEQVAADVGDPQRRVAEALQLGGARPPPRRRRRSAACCSRCRFPSRRVVMRAACHTRPPMRAAGPYPSGVSSPPDDSEIRVFDDVGAARLLELLQAAYPQSYFETETGRRKAQAEIHERHHWFRCGTCRGSRASSPSTGRAAPRSDPATVRRPLRSPRRVHTSTQSILISGVRRSSRREPS